MHRGSSLCRPARSNTLPPSSPAALTAEWQPVCMLLFCRWLAKTTPRAIRPTYPGTALTLPPITRTLPSTKRTHLLAHQTQTAAPHQIPALSKTLPVATHKALNQTAQQHKTASITGKKFPPPLALCRREHQATQQKPRPAPSDGAL